MLDHAAARRILCELLSPPAILSANGTGPDSTPPARVIHPLKPRFNGLNTGLVVLSRWTPSQVSTAAAPMPSMFNAGLRCPRSSRIATELDTPDIPK